MRIVLPVALLSAMACTKAHQSQPSSSTAASAVASQRPPAVSSSAGAADDVEYRLTAAMGEPVPHVFADDPENCREALYSGWFRISGQRWASGDSAVLTCPPALKRMEGQPRAFAGTIRQVGDTLYFEQYDSTRKTTLIIDRGIRRGDTLNAGFEGDERTYVRVRPGQSH